MKVFTAVPCGELSRFSEFWQCLAHVRKPTGSPRPGQSRGVYVPNNQNMLARDFLETDCEIFWLTNDDQAYAPNYLERMLPHFERTDIQVDIVCPNCLGHNPPHAPLLYDQKDGNDYGPYLLQKGVSGLIPILGAGGGGMLVRRKVFETIPDPWWDQRMCYSPRYKPQLSTEDFDFCEKAIQHGFKIWGDLDTPVGHYTIFNVSPMMMEDGSWVTALIRSDGATLTEPASKSMKAMAQPSNLKTVG